MQIDGVWKLSARSPMGTQDSTLDVRAEGGRLEGTQTDQTGSYPIQDGKLEDDQMSWSISITKPIPMTLSFTVAVEGDAVKGKVKAGIFGTFEISGARG